jgi:exodeoxyribonuclease VII large subunit
VQQRAATLERCGQLLNAFSHRAVLARGFALVRDRDGRPLRQAAGIAAGTRLDIEFMDGRVRAQAEAAAIAQPDRPLPEVKARARRGGGDPGQGSLFGGGS